MSIRFPSSEGTTYSPTSQYQLCHKIGQGSFGKVWLARCRRTGDAVALKVIARDGEGNSRQAWQENQREVNSWLRVDPKFPFITQMREFFSNDKCFFIALDYHPGGTIRELLKNVGPFPEASARLYSAELGLALSHLHNAGVIFRDLKTQNILLGTDGHLRLTDFGLSKIVRGSTTSLVGSMHIIAPEVFKRLEYDFKVDYYALGVCIYEMLSGNPPLWEDLRKGNKSEVMRKVIAGQLDYPESFSVVSRQLLQKLLHPDPEKRMGCLGELTLDPWYAGLEWAKILAKEYGVPFVAAQNGVLSLAPFPLSFVHAEAANYGMI